jgi:hypothetical protein
MIMMIVSRKVVICHSHRIESRLAERAGFQ